MATAVTALVLDASLVDPVDADPREENWLVRLVARDQGATCATSDGVLHRTCREFGVDVCRGL